MRTIVACPFRPAYCRYEGSVNVDQGPAGVNWQPTQQPDTGSDAAVYFTHE